MTAVPAWRGKIPAGRRARGGAWLALLLLAALATPTRAEEIVHSEFDLAGWLARDVISLGSDQFDGQSLALLLDSSHSTGVRARVDGPVLVRVEFKRPQFVRKVSLRGGNNSSYAVRLSVVPVGAEARLFGETVVSDGKAAMFRPIDERLSAIELRIECLELEQIIDLADLTIGGELHIRSLALENVPRTLPEGGSFEPRVRGLDSFGGRPDLTLFALILLTPVRALELTGKGRYTTRVGGPIALAPRMGELEGDMLSLLVQPLRPAPPAPTIVPGFEVVQLSMQANPPLRVFRRASGERTPRALGITFASTFYDEQTEPGTAYSYSVVEVDRFGNSTTKPSKEARVRTRTRPGYGMHEVGRCPVLVALYVDSFTRDGELDRVVTSIEAARGFLYRHGMGKPVLDLSYLAVRGKTPSTAGPSMAGIEADLADLGVGAQDFAIIYAVSNSLSGGHANFVLFGGSAGAMGRGPGVPTPADALGPDADVAWAFVHEIRHLLAARLAPAAGALELPSGDLAQDFRVGPLGSARGRPLDLGEAWDGQAVLARDSSWWDDAPRPWRLPFEIIDTDDDGLADDDPRLPFDERRFGSSPDAADTDGDGLDDLAEAAAGLYASSDPTRTDSDGDGLLDGVDPWPLSDFTGAIPYGEQPVALASGPRWDAPEVLLAACWTEDALVIEVTTPYAADVFIDLDGSGRLGRWESDVALIKTEGERPGSDVWCGPARLSLRAQQRPTGVFVGDRRVKHATVLATVRPGSVRLTAVLPVGLGAGAADATLMPDSPSAPGLRLTAGQVLGLAVTVRPSRAGDPAPFDAFPADGTWTSLFETHRLMDATLAAPE